MKSVIMKTAIFICAAIFSISPLYCQPKTKDLHIGDKVPDFLMSNILNGSKKSMRFSDFKGKLLIIDFWASWCGPCIAMFPRTDSLQKEFKDDVVILPVTYEDPSKAAKILNRVAEQYGILPMSVTNDTILHDYFPHAFLPHYVWIDRDGKVMAVTEANDVTRTNILAYKSSGKINFRLKEDMRRRVDVTSILDMGIQVLDIDNNKTFERVPDSLVGFQSSLTKFIEGLSSGAVYGGFGDRSGSIEVRNRSIMGLYRVALFGNKLESLNLTVLDIEIPDTNLYKYVTGLNLDGTTIPSGIESLNWLRTHGFTYRLNLPNTLAEKRFDFMLADLNRYFSAMFGIEGIIDKREHPYLALVQAPPGISPSISKETHIESNKLTLKLQNESIRTLVGQLTLPLQSHPPIYDETGYTGTLDLELDCNLSDFAAVNQQLKKYGLLLKEKKKLMNVAVLKMISSKEKEMPPTKAVSLK